MRNPLRTRFFWHVDMAPLFAAQVLARCCGQCMNPHVDIVLPSFARLVRIPRIVSNPPRSRRRRASLDLP
ncbi:hypothetical protein BRI6_0031 [plant metagenome]|uniref:Uncharacterized protein n=1 Tax=plant metagenome TaxID=1297885 RepID=A0A484RZ68_9ZZZZ